MPKDDWANNRIALPEAAGLFSRRIYLPVSAALPHFLSQFLSKSVAIVRGAKAATRSHRVLQSPHASSVVGRADVSRKLLHDVHGQLANGFGSCSFVRAGSCGEGRLGQASKIESMFHASGVEQNKNGKASVAARLARALAHSAQDCVTKFKPGCAGTWSG